MLVNFKKFQDLSKGHSTSSWVRGRQLASHNKDYLTDCLSFSFSYQEISWIRSFNNIYPRLTFQFFRWDVCCSLALLNLHFLDLLHTSSKIWSITYASIHGLPILCFIHGNIKFLLPCLASSWFFSGKIKFLLPCLATLNFFFCSTFIAFDVFNSWLAHWLHAYNSADCKVLMYQRCRQSNNKERHRHLDQNSEMQKGETLGSFRKHVPQLNIRVKYRNTPNCAHTKTVKK